MPNGVSVSELLDDLSSRGVELWVEDDKLKFRAPLGAVTPDLRDLVSSRKTQIVAHLRGTSGGDARTAPLSFNQQAQYFLHRSAPTSPAYNLGFALSITSPVNVRALHDALQALIRRHETLRTVYRLVDEVPRQFVGHEPVSFVTVNASGWDDARLRAAVDAAHRRPYDLEHGPVFRVNLFSRSTVNHLLQISMHHIAADGRAIWTLLNELRVLYGALAADSAAALPPLTATYIDFVGAQQRMLASAKGNALWEYWKGHLGDHLEPLALPWDRSPVSDEGAGASVPFNVPDALTDRLKQVAREHETTLFTLLMAAWQTLLFRYTGQTDILVGTPSLGRNQLEFQPVVGDFMNTVIVRGSLSGTLPFAEFLSSIRDRVFAAIEHEDFPFSLLVQRLGMRREPGRTPIFQSLFQLQKSVDSDLAQLLIPSCDARAIDFGGLAVEPYLYSQQEGQVDLTLEAVESGASLFGRLKYRTDRFDQTTAQRMCRHFETLLESVATSPRAPLGDLPILSGAEREIVVNAWNATDSQYVADAGVQTLIEAVVDRAPARVAVAQNGRETTYAELNLRANQIAHRLRRSGVGPGDLVGIGLTRTADMIAAVLAVLKAGGVYLPLDPEFPGQRLGWMLEDASPRLIVTERALVGRWPESAGISLLCLDDPSESIDNEPASNLPDSGSADSLAYTIFTSGSTGRPKGIQIPRRAVVNLLHGLQRQLQLTPDDRLLAVTTLSFDIAVAELLLPLTVGATIVLATRDDAGDPSRLAALLATGITVMQATPATWRMLCDFGWQGSASLRVLCGGETLLPDLASALLERSGEVWNLYGPSETTVWSTAARLTRGDRITIGSPIANTRIYVLDAARQPVPVGVAGEVWIGGDGVALGYHGRADLTAERFVDDPFRSGARIYRTGDLGRWLPDGRLEHLGRLDQQVKVRGFRIELPEIEAALLDMPSLREAAVLAESSGRGERHLVAYVVAHDDSVSPDSIRTALRVRLPVYMVPSRVVRLDHMPLTPNGKIDRRALSVIPSEPEPSSLEWTAPRTPMEQLLAEVWSEVLGVPQIGVHDNFFDLGGHSLLVTQLISRLSVRHGIDIPLRVLFDAPTIGQLADAVEEHFSDAAGHCASGERLSA